MLRFHLALALVPEEPLELAIGGPVHGLYRAASNTLRYVDSSGLQPSSYALSFAAKSIIQSNAIIPEVVAEVGANPAPTEENTRPGVSEIAENF